MLCNINPEKIDKLPNMINSNKIIVGPKGKFPVLIYDSNDQIPMIPPNIRNNMPANENNKGFLYTVLPNIPNNTFNP